MSDGGERQLWLDLNDERRTFLSAIPAEAHERTLALWTIGVSALVFLAALPFAKTQLMPIPAFIPTYQSALVVCDLITAVLLFSQFSVLGARPLLALAAGYLFTACMAAAHALTFPGLFSPAGLLGAGPQSTAWLYMFWHAGFPSLVIVYALLRAGAAREVQVMPTTGSARTAVAGCIAAVIAAACAFTFVATAGQEHLPSIMQGNRYTAVMVFVVSGVWGLSALALVLLWRRPPHTVLDLWLMVVMCAWLFDIGLAAVFNGGRYDLGFYAGRIYGLLAASFVLIVLLVENGMLYGRLLKAYAGERNERRIVQEKTAELIAANKELDAFSYSVSHDLRAPLRAMDGYARMLEEDFGARLDEEGRRLLGVVRASGKKMGRLIDDLLEFSRLGRQEPLRTRVDMGQLAREVAGELANAAPRAQVRIGELPGALADRSLIKQVWHNLVGNALKYSAKRPDPQVEIGARREAAETVFWVRDNGAGFDMRYAARLFGVFQRLHRAEEFPGTGVGLAIVQRIVARHGGRVWAEARPEAGATFHFSLPAEGAHEAA
jgi:signal transduction histidine kinase